jgi:hypothetical protein
MGVGLGVGVFGKGFEVEERFRGGEFQIGSIFDGARGWGLEGVEEGTFGFERGRFAVGVV